MEMGVFISIWNELLMPNVNFHKKLVLHPLKFKDQI